MSIRTARYELYRKAIDKTLREMAYKGVFLAKVMHEGLTPSELQLETAREIRYKAKFADFLYRFLVED